MIKLINYLVISLFFIIVGCSSKTPPPNATIQKQSQSPAQADAYPHEKFGLPESTRKQIAEEAFNVYTGIRRTAEQKYPFQLTDVLSKNMQHSKEKTRKRNEMIQSLWQSVIQELTVKYNLSLSQLGEIEDEGIDKDWIKFPKRPPVYK